MLNRYFKYLSLSNILIVGYLFLFIFTPRVFIPFSIIHVLTFISIYFIVTKYQNTFLSIVLNSELKYFIIMQSFLIIFTLALNSLPSGDYSTTYWASSAIMEVLPCAIFISIIIIKKKMVMNNLHNIILAIGMLQVVFVFLSFLIPGIRDWIILSAGSNKYLDYYYDVGKYRMYGFAIGYAFTMPLFQGLCVIVAFILGTFKSPRYFILIPFYVFSIAVNARVGLISIIIVSVIILFVGLKTHNFKPIAITAIVSFLLLLFVRIVQYQAGISSSLNSWVWLNEGIQEIINFKSGIQEGNMFYLAGPMWFMPKGIDLLIGSGEKVFGRIYQSSDIGYIINLHYGGIIYSMLLYFSYLYLLIKFKSANIIDKTINVSVVLYLLIANLKGDIFMPNEVIKGVLLLIVFSITTRQLQINSLRNTSARACST